LNFAHLCLKYFIFNVLIIANKTKRENVPEALKRKKKNIKNVERREAFFVAQINNLCYGEQNYLEM